MTTPKNPIRIFDSSLNLVTELDDYSSAYFSRSWSGCGEFSIQTNYNTVHAPDLQRGRIVLFDKNVYKCGIITSVKKEVGVSGKGSMVVTATGVELKGILGWRIVPPLAGREYYEKKGSAETVMKNIVNANGGPGTADADRVFSLLEIDTDAGLGSTYLLKTRWTGTVLSELSNCSLATNTGFYIYLDLANKKMRFATGQGIDRSGSQSVNPRAIFSTDYDTLQKASISDNDSNYRNYAFVGGQGEGSARTVREVYTGTVEPTDILRREMFVDARDLTTTTDLDTRGGQKLEELSTVITTDGSPLAYSPLVYGIDYDLGDIVTLTAYDVSRNVRITSVKESWPPSSYTIDMTFDKLPQTIQTQVSSAVSSVKSSIESRGAGIIESGYVSGRGWYVKFGDGTMMQWGRVITGSNNDGGTLGNFPVVGTSVDSLVATADMIVSGGITASNVTEASVISVTEFKVKVLAHLATSISLYAGVPINWVSFGRWRA